MGWSLVLAVMLTTACADSNDAAPSPAEPLDVQATVVETRAVPDWYEVGGIVQARVSATITSRVVAPVRAVRVEPGDRIRSGQLLVQLDARELAAHARRAEAAAAATEQGALAAQSDREAAAAALALAEATHTRISSLHERQSATTQELDEAAAGLRAAQAQLSAIGARIAEAEAALASARASAEAASILESYAAITAPFEGQVTEKLIEPGNMASPGTPLLRVESMSGFRVEVHIDESRVTQITPGQQVTVSLGGGLAAPLAVQGTVSEIARAIDADARTFRVRVSLEPGDAEIMTLRSGMFARVRFPGPVRRMLLVPTAAVVEHGQVSTVFVVDQDRARLRLVQTGIVVDDHRVILAGLEAGERVVVAPSPALVDARPVRLVSTPPLGEPERRGGGQP